MTENDSSWFQEDDSWRKTTAHVELGGWQTGFLAQSSALIANLKTESDEPWKPASGTRNKE